MSKYVWAKTNPQQPDAREAEVIRRVNLVGRLPRYVLGDEKKFNEYAQAVNNALTEASLNVDQFLTTYYRQQGLPDTDRAPGFASRLTVHKIMHLFSVDNGIPQVDYACPLVRQVFYKMINDAKDAILIKTATCFAPGVEGPRGTAYEILAHRALRSGGVYPQRHLHPAGTLHNVAPQAEELIHIPQRNFTTFSRLADLTKIECGHYYQPTTENFATMDSFAIELANDTIVIHMYQATTAKDHSLKLSGLLELINALQGATVFVFYHLVVPTNVAPCYRNAKKTDVPNVIQVVLRYDPSQET